MRKSDTVDGEAPDRDGVSLLQSRTEGPLYSVIRYDADDFEPLFVADVTRSMYPDEEVMNDHFERIHDYVNVDFMEMDLFSENLLPAAGEVNYITTGMNDLKIVRVYDGQEGVFLAVNPDETVVPLVEAVEGHLL